MPEPATSSYPGERLGLPQTGSGSVARVGRRILALLIDYAAATIIAMAFFGFRQFALPQEAGATQFAPMMVFAVIQILFIPTIGGSPGHRIVGLRLVMLGGGWVGLWRPIVRTVMLMLVIPAVVWDPDQRGLHDKAVGTVLIRA
ncbi:putative RDD family membrane protein YckC [Microbacterium resistens]|uniref:RDD family membrane protein YckC n=1 Tax=Microbacterium resistens TaxID=156977 RepID=A0ABU1S947_9MICO|nr:RDD family protein [Microbacterium resistens]MDR6866135.1 putative RDD family membrane protein YckC [Microbacterium resistens]